VAIVVDDHLLLDLLADDPDEWLRASLRTPPST
jgi:hypothetical protein